MQAALDTGSSDPEPTEVTYTAVNVYTNYFNHCAHTEPDVEATGPLTVVGGRRGPHGQEEKAWPKPWK
ncbi:hypothetical protein [Arthrobacter sp. M4]|uniref:hypothetical protein n=1 Tax=Arthrobacter sp. M4 TaxID=218160 RepID=UPI001CDCFD43|nr:hypothetical protein [Arthrobacter sp. M4]MCA4135636.1 hypothetical protein [Arthrobacter sp. M4]